MVEAEDKHPIPHFYLYGDETADVELDSVQIEPIRERSNRHNWIIHPHVHPDHFQILYFTGGGATIRIEEEVLEVAPLSLVVHPAGMVHDIRFQPGTEGIVTTTAVSYLTQVASDDPRLIEAVSTPGTFRMSEDSRIARDVDYAFTALMEEVLGEAPGRRTVIRAHFLNILVGLLRLRSAATVDGPWHRDRDYDLLVRYRRALDAHFREQKTLTFYTRALGVSAQRLNAACRARAGKTASETLHDRIVIEAKRNLLYTEMTVAEIGHSLGYDDPAYFNRFFAQRVGTPPGTYRAQAATTQRVSGA